MTRLFRSYGFLFAICSLSLMLWVSCSPEQQKECTSNADCTSNNCDPGTFTCIGTGENTVERTGDEAATGSEPNNSEPGQEPTSSEPTIGPEPGKEPGPEPGKEAGMDAGPEPGPEAGPEAGPEPAQEAGIPDGPVTQGPCQQSKPKCPTGYLCRDDVSPTQCHRVCDPNTANTCPSGALCLVLLSGEGLCVNGTPVKKGQACDNNKICEPGLICLRSSSSSPNGTCETRCTLKTQNVCPSGTFCLLVHSQNGVCIKGSPGTKAAGDACKVTTECAAGLVCFTPTQKSPRCSTLCDKQNPCSQGQRCAPLQNAPQGAGACVSN